MIPSSVEQYIQKYFGVNGSAVRDALKRYTAGDEQHRTEIFLAILHLSRGSVVRVSQMMHDLVNGRRRYVIENGMPKELAVEPEGFPAAPPRPPLPEAPATGSTPIVPSPAIRLNPTDDPAR